MLTVSDSRTPETDTGGAVIRELLAGGGHTVVGSAIVRDEPVDVARVVREACADARVQVVILTGGTVGARSTTVRIRASITGRRERGIPGLLAASDPLSIARVRGRSAADLPDQMA